MEPRWEDSEPIEPTWEESKPADEGLFGSATPTIKKVGDVLSTPFRALEKIPGYQEAKEQVTNSPLGLGQKAFDAAGSLANKLGEKTTETLSTEGLRPPFAREGIPVSPETAARAGTAVQMVPDALGVFGMPPNPTSVLKASGIASEAAPLVEQIATEAPKAPPPVNLGEEANQILKQPIPPRPSASSPAAESLASTLKSKLPPEAIKPMDEVSKYLEKEYGQLSKKPGIANTAADYLKEHSRNMALKEAGAAPGQIRKIGVERAHALADYMEDSGLVGPKIGTQGRAKLVDQRLDEAGGMVGAFRKMASDRGSVIEPDDLVKQVRGELDRKYLTPGMYSGQKGTYAKALAELRKTDGTAQALSDKVTEMFKEAKNQNPLNQPSGPLADVARTVRQLNHQSIGQHLTPEEMNLYEKSLEDYGALTQIKEFVKRRASVEAGGRLGPGSGISRAMVQKFLDSFGYRMESKVASKLADFIKTNPDVMTKPSNLFRQYIDEAAEAVHELGEPHQ